MTHNDIVKFIFIFRYKSKRLKCRINVDDLLSCFIALQGFGRKPLMSQFMDKTDMK